MIGNFITKLSNIPIRGARQSMGVVVVMVVATGVVITDSTNGIRNCEKRSKSYWSFWKRKMRNKYRYEGKQEIFKRNYFTGM